MAWVDPIHEVGMESDGWELCFQWGLWHFDDGSTAHGFRFIWRDPDGRMKPYRGQARIFQVEDILELLHRAGSEGWLRNRAEDAEAVPHD